MDDFAAGLGYATLIFLGSGACILLYSLIYDGIVSICSIPDIKKQQYQASGEMLALDLRLQAVELSKKPRKNQAHKPERIGK